MAGFLPNEGETLVAQLLFPQIATDRGTGLELGLFTNGTVGETTTEAQITEPTGTGYARIALTDGTWDVSGSIASYPQQIFTGGVGGWSGTVQGYFVATTGTTPRLIAIEVDPNGPYVINEGDTYGITPVVNVA